MNKGPAAVMTILIGLIAIATPISVSIYWAWKQTYDEQMAGVAALADDVLRRMNDSIDETFVAFQALEAAADPDPCSEDNRRLMRRLEIESIHIERIGYAVGDILVCSSAGPAGDQGHGVDMGPVTFDSGNGAVVRTNVEFPQLAPGSEFLVSTHQRTGFVVVIHRQAPLEVFLDRPDVSLGVVSRVTQNPIISRGDFGGNWVNFLDATEAVQFSDGRHLVVMKPSSKYALVAYAAIPVNSIQASLRQTLMVLVPIGLVAGIILAMAAVYFAKQQLAMPAVIRVALKRNEFFLVYQPIVELQSGRCVGAEALIRWQRRSGEIISPDIFIPVAESCGLIYEITGRVMDLVERDTAHLLKTHQDLHISMNFSAMDLENPKTVDHILALINKMGVQPHNLMIEATERGLMTAELARGVIDQIRKLNVKIAVDDFGTGYSSLSYLENFELDYLKIDKSFIDTIGAETATSQVAPYIIEMARALNLEMIAEGVETEAQVKYLQQRHVQYAQGWFFSKPMPIAEFTDYLESNLRQHQINNKDWKFSVG